MDTLLDRFLRYVKVDTQADERSSTYPSTPGQFELGRMLRDELLAMGYTDARQTEFGIVHATIPGTVPGAPVVALNSHVDTSPEFSGKNVNPQVIRNYRGGDIVLPKDPSRVIRVSENPELNELVGKTIVTTDGTTLLGGDDKAGVAVIMEVARILSQTKDVPHGPVKVVFTCDEEIGKGVTHLDPKALGAVVAYTLDGAGTGEVEAETFSADKATVTITGVNIHPALAKGRMVNAIRLAGMFLERLPRRRLTPETTDDRLGFIHPYVIDGGVPKTTIHCLLRDFDTPKLAEYAGLLRDIGRQLEREYPEAKVEIAIAEQYRNM
ncbi:MAG TPA: peptidase T, partial [Fimbriiglobus sp.]|nr:peptidase T [Fimbriiglobus sp.]